MITKGKIERAQRLLAAHSAVQNHPMTRIEWLQHHFRCTELVARRLELAAMTNMSTADVLKAQRGGGR